MIKLLHYPYKGHEIGEICDFGEEVNKSLIELQRAVLVEIEKKKKNKKPRKKTKKNK